MRRRIAAYPISITRGRPILELALVIAWAVLVTLLADSFINVQGVTATQLDMELTVTGGMPGFNDNSANSGDVNYSDKVNGGSLNGGNIHSTFMIESEFSGFTDVDDKNAEVFSKRIPDSKLPGTDISTNGVYIPRPRDLLYYGSASGIDKRTTYPTNTYSDDSKEVPSILPFIEMFKKTREVEQNEVNSSNETLFTSMDLVLKKRSQIKKNRIKHVLKVTNDIIQPAVYRPGLPIRIGKRETGMHSKSVSFEINPNQNSGTSGETIPKLNYNMNDVFYSLDRKPMKLKRQKETTETDMPLNEVVPQVSSSGTETSSVDDEVPVEPSTVTNEIDENAGNTKNTENDGVRSSDPHVDPPGLQDIGFDSSNIPQIPLGQVDTMDIDIPGEPLNPMDFMNAHLHVHETIDTSRRVDPTTMAERFEGDIILVEADKPMNKSGKGKGSTKSGVSKRSAIVSSERLWPNGTVPYVLSSTYKSDERAVIALALTNFHLVSCVRFVPRTNQRDYIHFLKGDGCSSNVGRIGGSQAVSLGPGCLHTGVVMHELMHTLGFWHEQSRSDRDRYIIIYWNNIIRGKGNNFLKYDFAGLKHVGKQYDLDSLMHYSQYAFARNRSIPTVEAISGKHEVGQRKGLSENDSRRLRELYPCPNVTAPTIFPNIHQPTVTLPPPTPGTCTDSDYHCALWAGVGECSKNVAWMKLNCRKSCKQCEMECEDLNKQCGEWRDAGQCERNGPYMNLYCQLTCNLCPSDNLEPPSMKCNDTTEYCANWAMDGNCEMHPDYMFRFCKKTCNRC